MHIRFATAWWQTRPSLQLKLWCAGSCARPGTDGLGLRVPVLGAEGTGVRPAAGVNRERELPELV